MGQIELNCLLVLNWIVWNTFGLVGFCDISTIKVINAKSHFIHINSSVSNNSVLREFFSSLCFLIHKCLSMSPLGSKASVLSWISLFFSPSAWASPLIISNMSKTILHEELFGYLYILAAELDFGEFYWNLTIRLFNFICRTLLWCLTSLQKNNRCILQPKQTGQFKIDLFLHLTVCKLKLTSCYTE